MNTSIADGSNAVKGTKVSNAPRITSLMYCAVSSCPSGVRGLLISAFSRAARADSAGSTP
eukprot:CAMPEP_0170632448 /NCGR_PEP_ID=MMETSP0224-20130122/35329_1 /TAXON_ID=285029 /ORGANISM="Togula jolla, Strain CCCM 725" /LENGTH=59 /DNA_ID=CAMNT_0010961153 /DNA_START=20 /DNA_END=199 /DNA_ORIENTATION=+